MPRSAVAARRPAPRAGAGRIRWDRVGRLAFVGVLAVIVLFYAAPLQHWFEQKRTAAEHAAELERLESENARLKRRAGALTRPDAIEREARRLGMIERGERPYVIENLP
jgi:cell division protein FtsB